MEVDGHDDVTDGTGQPARETVEKRLKKAKTPIRANHASRVPRKTA